MLYVPPDILTDVAALMPVIVTVFDVCVALLATPFVSEKENASGVTSDGSASVVDVNVSDTPPDVRVVLTAVNRRRMKCV